MTTSYLRQLDYGYDLDGGGYAFEAPEEGAPLSRTADGVWTDPDLDYLGLQDTVPTGPGRRWPDLIAVSSGSPDWPTLVGPAGELLYLLNDGKLLPHEHECNCHGKLVEWVGPAAGEPDKPLCPLEVGQWLYEDAVPVEEVVELLGRDMAWQYTADSDRPHPRCERCGGEGLIDVPGGSWAVYTREAAPELAVLLRTDGTAEAVAPANGTHWTLEEVQGHVGGYVRLLRRLSQAPEEQVALVDEDGLLKQLPPNAAASVIAGQPLVGDVLLTHADTVR